MANQKNALVAAEIAKFIVQHRLQNVSIVTTAIAYGFLYF